MSFRGKDATAERGQAIVAPAGVVEFGARTLLGFLDEFFLDLQASTRDAQELKDVAAEVYTAARAAGI